MFEKRFRDSVTIVVDVINGFNGFKENVLLDIVGTIISALPLDDRCRRRKTHSAVLIIGKIIIIKTSVVGRRII